MALNSSSKLQWFSFYHSDWLMDPNLRRCSLAARGLWIDLLCLMFTCDVRGVLATRGVPWTLDDIATLLRADISLIETCIEELLKKGVASKNKRGALLSRRMMRDEEARANGRERKYNERKRKKTQKNSHTDVTAMSSVEQEQEGHPRDTRGTEQKRERDDDDRSSSSGDDSAGADTRTRSRASSSSSSRSRKKQSPDGDVCGSILRIWNDNCEPEFKRVRDTPTRRNFLRICIKRHNLTPQMIFEALQYMKRFGGGNASRFDNLIHHDTIVRTLWAAERSMAKANGGKHANA